MNDQPMDTTSNETVELDSPYGKQRWKAKVSYRTDKGSLEVEFPLFELSDLGDQIDAGPHWDAIEQIVVVRVNHITYPWLTLEQADVIRDNQEPENLYATEGVRKLLEDTEGTVLGLRR